MSQLSTSRELGNIGWNYLALIVKYLGMYTGISKKYVVHMKFLSSSKTHSIAVGLTKLSSWTTTTTTGQKLL